jgi:hypothetical protein
MWLRVRGEEEATTVSSPPPPTTLSRQALNLAATLQVLSAITTERHQSEAPPGNTTTARKWRERN